MSLAPTFRHFLMAFTALSPAFPRARPTLQASLR